MRKLAFLSIGTVALLAATPSFAADHVVRMLSSGPSGAMVFQPALTRVAPGDTVIAGVAWAPHRGIRRVEVSVDDGPWEAARLGAVASES